MNEWRWKGDSLWAGAFMDMDREQWEGDNGKEGHMGECTDGLWVHLKVHRPMGEGVHRCLGQSVVSAGRDICWLRWNQLSPYIYPPLREWRLSTTADLNGMKSNSILLICLAAPGWLWWNSTTSLGVWTLSHGSQELCSILKSFHFTKYHNFLFTILLSRISSTIYSSSPSMIGDMSSRDRVLPGWGQLD